MSENTTTGAWVLPDDVATMLRDAYSHYREMVTNRASGDAKREALRELAVIAKAGREKKWPYPEMAAACDMTAERLRQIVATLDKERPRPQVSQELKDQFPDYVAPPHQRKKQPARRVRKTKRSTLTEAEIKKLQELAPLARTTSGSTPMNSPVRKATKEFSKLIIKFHSRGVIWRELAEVTGLSEAGVRSRAARHGYHNGPPPSIPPYRDTTIYKEAKVKKRQQTAQAKAEKEAAKDQERQSA